MPEKWNILKVLNWTKDYFQKHNIKKSRLNAELLISGILNVKRLDLYLNFDKPLEEKELELIREAIKRRIRKEPIQYILGIANFYGFDFYVDKNVLIPRPETEELVEYALKLIKSNSSIKKIIDIGTGSGCIIIILNKLLGNEYSYSAVDISSEALKVAEYNAKKILEDNKINFFKSDLFSSVKEKYDLIISNPPYISEDFELDDEVVKYEPKIALFAKNKGLYFYEKLAENSYNYLNDDGYILLEIGYDQGDSVKNIFSENNKYIFIELKKDISGNDRIILFKKNN